MRQPDVPGGCGSYDAAPLGGAQIVTMVTARTRGHLRPPSVPRQCPRDVWDLILACTLPDPSHRPAAKGPPPLAFPQCTLPCFAYCN